MADNLQDVDALFPEKPPPDVDQLFPASIEDERRYRAVNTGTERSSPVQDFLFRSDGPVGTVWHSAGRVLDAFGHGANEAGPAAGLSQETNDYLKKWTGFKDWNEHAQNLGRAFNNAIVKPAAFDISLAWRAMFGAFSGGQAAVAQLGEEIGQPKLGREMAAVPEAFFGSPHPTAMPHLTPEAIAKAAELRVIGPDGEAGFLGTKPASEPAPGTPAGAPPEPVLPEPPPPDLHAAVRAASPPLFEEYDALNARRDILRRFIEDREDTDRAGADMARVATNLKETEARLRDLAPQVAEAYRKAEGEVAPQPPAAAAAQAYKPGLIAQGLDPSDAVKKQWAESSPINTVDDLFTHAQENQDALAKVGDQVASELGIQFRNPGVKGRPRTQEKVDQGKAPGRINDVVRGGFVVETPAQADAAVARLAQHFEVADEGWAVTPVGYFDRKVMVRFANGQVGEVQLWHPDMLRAKTEKGHRIYVESRSMPHDDPRRAALDAQMQEIYSGALADAAPEWKALLGSDGSEGNLASNAALESVRPPTAISELSARDQEPSRTTQASPGDQTKGSPSKEPYLGSAISTSTDNIRIAGETDKAFAKRVVDKREAPAKLPEDYGKYFVLDDDTRIIPLSDLVSSKSESENAQGAENGAKRMAAAAAGELSRRAPIEVKPRGDGKYVITDGNGTFSSVQRYGWQGLPAKVVGQTIANDVTRRLMAAGRTPADAEASGRIVQAYWETRAARFKGRKGTAEEMYRREAPDIVGGPGVRPAQPIPPETIARAERVLNKTQASAPATPADASLPPQERAAPLPGPLPNAIQSFAPGDLIVDAKRFQFKDGGDESGVTDRLKGVTKWDPIKAGMALVWQDRNGQHFIVDGHQRHALATRIAAEDPSQKPELLARVVREADGVTDAAARVMAAAKNIAEGTGTAVDAAKVLRDRPDLIKELPPRSDLVRQARGLVNLSDAAFRMVVNDVVPPQYAAVVGRLVPQDAELQSALLGLLAKTEPANAVQAEAIVRQGIDAGVARREAASQGSLFGDEDVATSLYVDRAKVLDKALKEIKRDKAVFAVLSKEQTTIEAAGNKLAADINEKRAAADAQALQVLQILAGRKGPISDALNAAARRARSDGKPGGAVTDFVRDIRRLVETGDLARLADGVERGPAHVGAEDAASTVERAPERVSEKAEQKAASEVRDLVRQAAPEGRALAAVSANGESTLSRLNAVAGIEGDGKAVAPQQIHSASDFVGAVADLKARLGKDKERKIPVGEDVVDAEVLPPERADELTLFQTAGDKGLFGEDFEAPSLARDITAKPEALHEGSSLRSVATEVKAFSDDAQALLGVARQHDGFEVPADAGERKTLVNALADARDLLDEHAQTGYDLVERIEKAGEDLYGRIDKLDDDLRALRNEADELRERVADKLEEIHDAHLEELNERREAEEEAAADAREARGEERYPSTLPALREPPSYPAHYTALDVIAHDKRDIAATLDRVKNSNAVKELLEADVDKLDEASADRITQAVDEDLTALNDAYHEAQFWTEGRTETFRDNVSSLMDSVNDDVVRPLLDAIEDASMALDKRVDEGLEGNELFQRRRGVPDAKQADLFETAIARVEANPADQAARQELRSLVDATKAGPQNVMPGFERSAVQAAASREAAGGLRSEKPQEAAGDLFADHPTVGRELFDQLPESDRSGTVPEPGDTFGPAGEPLGEPGATGAPAGPDRAALRGGAPQIPVREPARRPRGTTKVQQPGQLSLFGGDHGERAAGPRPESGAGGPGTQGPAVPGAGESVTKPPSGGGGDDQARPDTPASRGLSAAEQKIAERSRLNYRITPDDLVGEGGPKQKVRGNLEAIRVLKEIEDENREATPAEKAILVKYTGWGAHAQEMFAERRPEWANERTALRAALNDAEYEAARASTPNAHFTSPEVIRGMWAALDHLGFNGGLAIEPSAGIGHFIGLIPDTVAPRTAWTAVELDSITGRIAKALYGGAEVNVHGFEDLKRPSNYYDLAISNVPFGDYPLKEKPYGSFPIHDFFFVKSLDKVRPGGVVSFVTSRYSMDRVDASTRRLLAKTADLVGAIRLPGGRTGAFSKNAGTEVTTDILFLRKKIPGEAPFPGAAWTDLKEHVTPDGPVKINEYFADHPDMMLGEMRLQGTQYRKGEPVLVGDTEGIEQRIGEAARKNMQAGAITPTGSPATTPKIAPDIGDPIHANDIAAGIRDGAFFVRDGKIYQRLAGQGVDAQLSGADHARVSKLVGMRDTINALLDAQINPGSADAEALRKQLRDAYDAFVDEHGPINLQEKTVTKRIGKDGEPITITRSPNLAPFKEDPDAWKVAAIENYDPDTGNAKRADIQTKDVIAAPKERQINGPADALAASLDDTGRIDLDHIGRSLGLDTHEDAAHALGDLVYQNPDGRHFETADQYLSGDVVKKLEDARAIAKDDPSYLRNVGALEKVQPTPLKSHEIMAQFGAPWVPPEVYADFFKSLGVTSPRVSLVPVTREWRLNIGMASRDAESKFGTSRVGLDQVADAAMNNRKLTVWDKGPDDTRVVNQTATEEANVKVQLMKDAFAGDPETGVQGWVWDDADRAQQLEAIYNRTFNNIAPRKFDGSHLTLPGLNPDFATRQHRKDAVWRMVQNGNTLLAHVVGSGKTATMIAGGQEMKRLGLINKPAYVVPNHMLEQFSREFIQAYPNAKILVAQKEEMSRDNRRAFIAKAAANDWDGVIITHDAFGRVNTDPEFRRQFLSEQLDELERLIKDEAQEGGDKSPTVKALEKAKKRLSGKLTELMAEGRKDEGVSFEETGIDHLFVDEAHKFKNLAFNTRMQRVKGLAQGDSQRAEDLFLKISYLEQKRPGRSAVFATGTPVSNTMAELWTMMRYLGLDKLKERGLDSFDAWAQTFGRITNTMELSADGRTFKEASSFSRFVNVPELINIYGEIADTKTADMLNLKRPEVKTRSGAPGIEIVEATPSEAEEAHINHLVELAESLKGKRPEPGQPNILSVVTQGRKVATDGRLIGPDFEFNPQGKIAKAVDNINRIYQEGNEGKHGEHGKVQMVFLDLGTPKTKSAPKKPVAGEDIEGEGVDLAQAEGSRLDLYADIKQRLIEKGIPADEIAAIHDAPTDDKKARLFERVRRGDVRVFLGSTEKMGVGTNVQDRLIAMHHLDAPWKPAEVEQRDGRIVRQGNRNPQVGIYRYVTKKSFDAFMWQKLDTKSKFIGQVLSGAKGSRFAEDIDNPLPEAAEMKAAASGDPRILEHAELDRQVRTMTAQRRAHEQTRSRADWELKTAQARIDQYEKALPDAKEDAAQAADISGDKFAVEVGGKTVTDRAEAGQQILDGLLKLPPSNFYRPQVVNVGRMAGFDMNVELANTWSGDGQMLRANFSLRGKSGYGSPNDAVINAETPAAGLIRRFENILAGIRSNPDRLAGELDRERDNVKGLVRTLGEQWPKENEYRGALGRLKTLTDQLGTKEHPDVAAQEGAKTASDEAKPTELYQGGKVKQGKITLRPGQRSTITLFREADASTFMHETAHDWLDRMMKDAEDAEAPDDIKADAATVFKWLGVDKAADIRGRHHEKFARGFETYLMEGRAPSQALASVFAKFKAWLTRIYQTVQRLGSPINDDIRAVFDRFLTTEPSRTVEAPERQPAAGIADIHEGDVAAATPESAHGLAETVRSERDRTAAHDSAEDTAARLAGAGAETRRGAPGGAQPGGDGDAPGAVGGEARTPAPSGTERPRGGETEADGAQPRQGAAEGTAEPAGPQVASKPPAGPSQPFESVSPLIDKAGNIRLDLLNGPDDVKRVIRDAAEKNNQFLAARRNVISDQQRIDLAAALGMDAAKLNQRRIGQAFNAEEVTAARDLLVQSATAVRDAMAKAADGNEADLVAFAEARERHLMIQEHVAGITAEAGRALRAFRSIAGIKEAKELGDFLRDASGLTLFQLRRMAKLGSALPTPQQVSQFVHNSAKPSFSDMILEYWINALISGPATHTTYAIGNALLALNKAGPETAVAASIGAVRRAFGDTGERVYFGEVPAQMFGMVKGFPDAIVATWESAKTGRTTALPGELANQTPRQAAMSPLVNPRAAIPNFTIGGVPVPVGTLARLPSRVVAMIHSFTRFINFSREKAAIAYRTAASEGLDGQAFKARTADIYTNPAEEVMRQSRESATDLALMGKGGELTTALSRLTNAKFLGFQWLKFVDPFVHISSNVIEQAILQRTPIGIADSEIRANLMGHNGPVARDMAIARMVVGSAIGVGVGALAAQGLVNGSGPSDPHERAIATMTNGPPHSIRIGDMWYDIHRLGPLGMQFSIAADLYHLAHVIGKEDGTKVVSELSHAFTQNILDESFMRGPADLMKALSDPDRYGAGWVKNFASSFVPFSVGQAQIARAIDPYSRSARTTLDAMRAKVPWLSETLLPRRDVFGEPIPNKEALGVAGLSAIYEEKVNRDPVPKAMLDAGYFPAMPNRKIRDVELTDQQYDDYARIGGRMAKVRLDAIVRSPGFSDLPPGVRHDMLRDAVTKSRQAAESLIIMRNPDIIQAARDAKLAKFRGEPVH